MTAQHPTMSEADSDNGLSRPVLSVLQCHLCAQPLAPCGQGLCCARGHSFNRAKQGYVSLLVGSNKLPGDTAEMVAHRLHAHTLSPYQHLIEGIAGAVQAGVIVDVGCGPGDILDAMPGGDKIGLDSSPYALRRAAKRMPGGMIMGADITQPLPLASHGVSTLISCFAPRNWAEFGRVLGPAGRAIVVTPLPEHLGTLRERVPAMLDVPDDKASENVKQARGHGLVEHSREMVNASALLPPEDALSVVMMGPAGFHTTPEVVAEALGPAAIPVHVACTIQVFGHEA